MYKHIFKYSAFILTILTANLITSAISDLLITYKNNYKPLTFTLLGMAVIVIIFYPLFTKLEELINGMSKNMIRTGHSIAGKYTGLFLVFVFSMLILLYFYARMWYNIDILVLIFNGKFFQYF